MNKNIPIKYQNTVKKNFKEVDEIAGFLRQFLVSIILGFYYFIIFYLIGIDYSLFLGVFSGIFSLIPYFGIFISFILSAYISLLQFADSSLYFLYNDNIFSSFFIRKLFFVSKNNRRKIRASSFSNTLCSILIWFIVRVYRHIFCYSFRLYNILIL